MRRVRDVRCTQCKAVYIDEYCDDDFQCTCGGRAIAFYGAQSLLSGGSERKADAFSTIVFGGERYESRDAWEGFRKEWRTLHHEELNVSGDSPAARKVMLEESHHKSIAEAHRRGMPHIAAQIERAGARIR